MTAPFDPFALPLFEGSCRSDFLGALPPSVMFAGFSDPHSDVTVKTPELALRTSLALVTEHAAQRAAFTAQDDASTFLISFDVLDAPRRAPSLLVSRSLKANVAAGFRSSLTAQAAAAHEPEKAPVDDAEEREDERGVGGPLIPVRFRVERKATANPATVVQRLQATHGPNAKNRLGVTWALDQSVRIKCDVHELALMEALLLKNAALVDPAAAAAFKRSPESADGYYALSFLSVLPLPPADASEAPAKPTCCNPGCTHVGSAKCGGCNGAFYCGPECQRADWKAHKQVCERLDRPEKKEAPQRDDKSVLVPLGQSPTPGHKFVTNLNRQGKGSNAADTTIVAPNVHGTSKFLVKCQVPLGGRGAAMIYDEKRSFQAFYDGDELQRACARFSKVPKVFLWAKREGNNLRVFIDAAAKMQNW